MRAWIGSREPVAIGRGGTRPYQRKVNHERSGNGSEICGEYPYAGKNPWPCPRFIEPTVEVIGPPTNRERSTPVTERQIIMKTSFAEQNEGLPTRTEPHRVRPVRKHELRREYRRGESERAENSIGLALSYPNEFRACIGLEASMWSGNTDRLVNQWFHHPRLSNESKPALMLSLCSPNAPEEYIRETVWEYSQGAPPVFKGDLYYYAFEHDLRQTAKNIDR